MLVHTPSTTMASLSASEVPRLGAAGSVVDAPRLCGVVVGDLVRRRDTGTFPLAVDPSNLHSGSVRSSGNQSFKSPCPYLHILHLPSIAPRRVNFTMSPLLPKSRSLSWNTPPPNEEVQRERRGHKFNGLVIEEVCPLRSYKLRDEAPAATRSRAVRKLFGRTPLSYGSALLRRCDRPLKQISGLKHRWHFSPFFHTVKEKADAPSRASAPW